MKNLAFGLFLALALAAPAALADLPPPDSEGCDDREAGDACKTDAHEDGGCVKETCSRAVPGGEQSEKYPCLICKKGAQPNKGGCATSASGSAGPLGLAGIAAAVAAVAAVTRRHPKRTTK